MTDRLAENCGAVLSDRGVDADVEVRWSRLVAWTDDATAAADALAEVPGVVWTRPTVVTSADRASIEETLVAVTSGAGTDSGRDAPAVPGDGTFAVRATCGDDQPFDSRDVERFGGRAVETATGAAVDLDDPDVTVRVECRGDDAFVSTWTTEGPGGLPVGTGGRVVALVSGGIDSPVAAHELLRRGCHVVPVYVDLGAYGGPDHEARAVSTVAHLARCVPHVDTRVRVVELGEVVERLVAATTDTRMLSLRRAMLAAAEVVARAEGAHALATGEVMGQKSTQTGPNLAVTEAAVSLPVHRPLLTWDKRRIVERARELGTYDDSTLPVGCERVAPAHPETAATRSAVRAAEPEGLLEAAAAAGESPRLVAHGTTNGDSQTGPET
jgi:thiamine biosynthesis protein ThiI